MATLWAKIRSKVFHITNWVSPKESRHIVNRRVLEHLSRAGVFPAMEKEIVYVEKGNKAKVE